MPLLHLQRNVVIDLIKWCAMHNSVLGGDAASTRTATRTIFTPTIQDNPLIMSNSFACFIMIGTYDEKAKRTTTPIAFCFRAFSCRLTLSAEMLDTALNSCKVIIGQFLSDAIELNWDEAALAKNNINFNNVCGFVYEYVGMSMSTSPYLNSFLFWTKAFHVYKVRY